MDEYESLSHSKWECKYHVVFIPKGRRKVLYGQLHKHLGEVCYGYRRPEPKRLIQEDFKSLSNGRISL